MDRTKMIALVGTMLAIGIILGAAASAIRSGPVRHEPPPMEPPSEALKTAKVVIAFVNLFLILSLLIIYLDIYRTVNSKFTIGLIVAILALLVYAITSNPIFQMLLGYGIAGPGPFLFIPDIFTAVAAAVLIYLSIE